MHSAILAFVLSTGLAHSVAAPPAALPSVTVVSPAMGSAFKCSAPRALANDSSQTVKVCEVSR